MKTNTRSIIFSAVIIWGASVAVIPAKAQEIYLQTDFQEGIPSNYTVLDRDENPTRAGLRNIVFTDGSWVASLVDSNEDQAAVSSSYSVYDYPVEDWLITPNIYIASEAACLRWQARSVHYDYRDGYAVMISVNGTSPADFVELFRVEEEDYYERMRVLPLDAYVGKNVHIAFVHNSTKRFMLAIDDIMMGELAPAYVADNHTPVSVAGGDVVAIEGEICNAGSPHNFYAVCKTDGVVYDPENILDREYAAGESYEYHFELPTPLEGKVAYRIGVPQDNDTAWVVTDTIYCSTFARRMLVEEYTAKWCTSCPSGTIMMHDFEHRFREGIIPIVAHINYNDPMGDDDYSAGLGYWLFNMPSFIYDRVSKFKSQEARADGNIYQAFSRPVEAEIDLYRVAMTEEGRLQAQATVRFAHEFDNTDDSYRVAFIVTENSLCVDSAAYNQSNGSMLPTYAEFYFLPLNIPGEFMQYNHVARGLSDAFTGVPALLPATTLQPDEDYQIEYLFEIPATVKDIQNISVTAVVLDTHSREVLNACRALSIDYSGAVGSVSDASMPHRVLPVADGVIVQLAGNAEAEARLYSLDGRMLTQVQGKGELHLVAADAHGAYILVIQDERSLTCKKILINTPL